MGNDRVNLNAECGRFLDQLELVHAPGDAVIERGELLAELPLELQKHAGGCGSCLEALDDKVETRNLLLSLATEAGGAAEPGPWFSTKVMNAIAAREVELEESRDGVWLSVRRLAPRLVAVCALLLVLIGSWAMETQREYQARRVSASGESLFDSGPSGPQNDDVLVGAGAQ